MKLLTIMPLFVLQEALRGLLYRKAGMHDGKMRKDILYADFVLRESARQASVEICFLCASKVRIKRYCCIMFSMSISQQSCSQLVPIWIY